MNAANDPDIESLLQFPCSFPIKVMGHHTPEFEMLVAELVSRHAGELPEGSVRSRTSSNSRYLAVTITIEAQSREQLDKIYRSLSDTPQVLLVL